MKKFSGKWIVLILIFSVFGVWLIQRVVFYQTLTTLKSISYKEVQVLKIYPNASMSIGTPIEFRNPDSIIKDFLRSIADIQKYWGGGYTVEKHGIFIEIFTTNQKIQMNCSIPTHKRNTIVGWIDDNDQYESKLLFQWYQTYSHRWLTPEGSPSAPSP